MALETQLIDTRRENWKNHLADNEEILQQYLDLHEASLLTIECARPIKSNSEHHLCVWTLTDHFLHKL